MKPKPRSETSFLTVPVVIRSSVLFSTVDRRRVGSRRTVDQAGAPGTAQGTVIVPRIPITRTPWQTSAPAVAASSDHRDVRQVDLEASPFVEHRHQRVCLMPVDLPAGAASAAVEVA